VIDVSHPQFEDQRAVGDEVLRDLGVPAERVVEIYNKADRADATIRRRGTVTISALDGRGIDNLIELIRDRELAGGEVLRIAIPHDHPRLLAQLHQSAVVYEQATVDGATVVTAWVPREVAHQFEEFAEPVARARRA